MKNIATRELWARQSLLLSWGVSGDDDWEYIQVAGRELMRRTDTSPARRARAAVEQTDRRKQTQAIGP